MTKKSDKNLHANIDLRDWFACQAMTSIINPGCDGFSEVDHQKVVAYVSYKFADAMMIEREKNNAN